MAKKKEINIDDYFAVIYQDTIDVFSKEKLNDFLFKKYCLVCDLETAKDYKKFHKSYVVSNEKWVRDYFGFSEKREENIEKDLYYNQNKLA